MNKWTVISLAVAALAAPRASAVLVKVTDLDPNWSGGPFSAQLRNDANTANIGTAFQTFCLERSEKIKMGKTYNVAFSDAARHGGSENPSDSTPNADEISWGTAWLYSQFRADESFADSVTELKRLQNAIWFLEDEGTTGVNWNWNSPDRQYYNAARTAAQLAGVDVNQDAAGAFGVQVMNLTKYENDGLQGTRRQDLLYLTSVPDGGTTLMLLGFGLAGLAFGSRRSSR